MPKIVGPRECYACGTDKSFDCNGYRNWATNPPTDLFLCKTCTDHYVWIPTRDKEIVKKQNAVFNPMKIRFLGARLFIGWNPRKAVCGWCKLKVGAPYTNSRGKSAILKMTQMHHYFYISCMPWACMIELCTPCHNKTKTRTRKKVSSYYFDRTLRIKTKKRGI